jgi:polyhydroxybutyrate depolymerase
MRTFIAAISLVLGACSSTESGGNDGESSEGSAGTSSTGAPPTTSTTTTGATSATGSGESSTGAVDGSSSEGGEEESSTTDDGPPPAACDVAMPLPPGDYDRMLEHGGVMRRYYLHVSESTQSSAPLVVNMHGYLSNPTMQSQWSQLNDAAEARGIITAHPEGLDNSWNAGVCCGTSQINGVDDIGFIRAVVADIQAAACVDPQRIYATGLSNGGFMSNRLGCEAADLFAAVAPVVGALRIPLEECMPERPMPIFAFNGVQDPLVPYADAVATIDRWVELEGCDAEPTVEQLEGGHCDVYSGCEGDGDVRFCTLDPMGHCWPGGDPNLCYSFIGPHSDAVDATARMLDFFAQHTLP